MKLTVIIKSPCLDSTKTFLTGQGFLASCTQELLHALDTTAPFPQEDSRVEEAILRPYKNQIESANFCILSWGAILEAYP